PRAHISQAVPAVHDYRPGPLEDARRVQGEGFEWERDGAGQVLVVEFVAGQDLDQLGTVGHQASHRSPVDRMRHYATVVEGEERRATASGERMAAATPATATRATAAAACAAARARNGRMCISPSPAKDITNHRGSARPSWWRARTPRQPR